MTDETKSRKRKRTPDDDECDQTGLPSAKRARTGAPPGKQHIAERKRQAAKAKKARSLAFAQAKPRFKPLRSTNFVCTCNTLRTMNLSTIALLLHGRHKKKAFPSVTVHIRNPRVTASIFAQGGIVTTGAKSEAMAREAVMSMLKLLSDKLGLPPDDGFKIYNWKLQNVVGAGGLGKRLDIEAFAEDFGDDAQLEFKTFPGCRYKVVNMRQMRIVLFHSGMYLVTGGLCEQDLIDAFATIIDKLPDYMEGGKRYRDTTIQRLDAKLKASKVAGG